MIALVTVSTDAEGILDCLRVESGRGPLALLAGAGVSMVGGTRLPSGPQLLEDTYRRLVTDDRLAVAVDDLFARDEAKRLVPELVLQRVHDILETLPAFIYAPFVDARPNAVHLLVAQMCAEGHFVATTNFDLAIETAARRAQLTLPDHLPIHLHGRADKPETIVHTIRQVGRGLPKDVSRRLTVGLSGKSLIVIGYSGNDREVLNAITAAKPSAVFWVVRDQSDRAVANIDRILGALARVDTWAVDLGDCERLLPKLLPGRRTTRARAGDVPSISPLLQLEMLLGLALQLQDYAFARSLVLKHEWLEGEPCERASILALGAFAERRTGDMEAAVRLGERALDIAPGGSRPTLAYRINTEIGLAYLDRDPPQLDAAQRHLAAATEIADGLRRHAGSAGDNAHAMFASAVHNLGYLHERQGDYPAALAMYETGLRLKKEVGDLPYQISSERDVSLMLALLGRAVEARDHFDRFTHLADMYGDRFEIAFYFLSLARLRRTRGDYTGAVAAFREAGSRFRDHGDSKYADLIQVETDALIGVPHRKGGQRSDRE
jgi:tetratricopeptide (TPR) repeat protein